MKTVVDIACNQCWCCFVQCWAFASVDRLNPKQNHLASMSPFAFLIALVMDIGWMLKLMNVANVAVVSVHLFKKRV